MKYRGFYCLVYWLERVILLFLHVQSVVLF